MMRNPDLVDNPVTLDELRGDVLKFIHWVSRNNFSDPKCMLVCAEWFNLCGAVDEPMHMAGSAYREANPEGEQPAKPDYASAP